MNVKIESWAQMAQLSRDEVRALFQREGASNLGVLFEDFSPPESFEEMEMAYLCKKLYLYYDVVVSLAFQNWHPELQMRTWEFSPFFYVDAESFKELFDPFVWKERELKLEGFAEFLASLPFPPPYFVKVGARSPKDSLDLTSFEGFSSQREILECFQGSERVIEEAIDAGAAEDRVPITVRPFLSVDRKYEFRIFVEKGEILGISQYYFNEYFGYTSEELKLFEQKMRAFILEIHPFVGRASYVADLYIKDPDNIVLIELNPFGLSDPCLYREIPFDRGLHVVETPEEAF